MRIDLPNGQWAELRDPSEVTERHRRPIQRATRGIRPDIFQRGQEAAAMADGPDGTPTKEKETVLLQLQYDMTNEEADAFTEANDHATVALVESWSFVVKDAGEPVPVTIDGLLDLPGHALDALRKAVEPYMAQMRLDTSPDPNRPAPTGGSNGSATPSVEVLPTTSLTSGGSSSSSGPA